MAADARTRRAGAPGNGSDERWQRMWSHREALLRIARRRSVNTEDAEDAVHEAMLRAVESPNVDDERLGAWLTAVTIRLCVDRHRRLTREAEVHRRAAPVPLGRAPVEEAVCDRAEAAWLARRSRELPARQAQALWLKADDLDVGQIARTMGLSYEAAESLLGRARRALRGSLAGTLAAAVWLGRALRPRAGGPGGQAAAAVSTVSAAATLAVAGVTAPHICPERGPHAAPRPPLPRVRQVSAVHERVDVAPRRPAVRAPVGGPAGFRPAGSGSVHAPRRVGIVLPLPRLPLLPAAPASPVLVIPSPPLPALPPRPAGSAPHRSPVPATVVPLLRTLP